MGTVGEQASAAEQPRPVRDLWVLLRSHGIDAHLDLLAAQQRQDWALWMADQVREAANRPH